MVKARIQAYSPAFPVGAQHNYKSSFDALRMIVQEGGVRSLWRGVNAALLRTAMVSLVTLSIYPCGCVLSAHQSFQVVEANGNFEANGNEPGRQY